MKKFFKTPGKTGRTSSRFSRIMLLLLMALGTVAAYAQTNCTGFSGNYSKSDTGCYGSAVGSILATPINGAAPYMYKLNSGSYGSASQFNNLRAGNYRVYIMDANACITVSPIIAIQQYPAVTCSAAATNTVCHDSASTITVTPLTGTAPFRYRLGSSGPFGPSNTLSVYGSGTFVVTMMDAHGCTGIARASVTNPVALTATTTKVNASPCATSANGSATINPTSGLAPFLFKLNPTGTYASSNTFSGLKAGSYKLYMKDANGCAIFKTVVISAPAAVIVSDTKINPTCTKKGSITLGALQSPNATFRLSPGSSAYTPQYIFDSLAAGTYYGYAKSTNGCIGRAGPIVLSRPPLCNNGLILWYPFSGNANDSSGSANHGNVTNATLTSDRFGRPNSAYRFYGVANNGPSTIVSQNNINIVGAAPRTVSFWFNWYSVSNPEAPGLVGWGNLNNNGGANWLHIKQDSSMVQRGHYLDFYSTAGIIHTHQWNHVVYTYDGAKGTFYINGVKNTTANYVAATIATTLQIGHSTDTYLNPFDWPAYFDGAMDDIRIYNRALDSSEARFLYLDSPSTSLRQLVDKDSKKAYSKIEKVSFADELGVTLSPNPSSNVFKLRVNTTKTEAIQLRVIDINGKVAYTAKGSPTQTFSFGEALSKGVYMIEVRQGNEVKTTKVIKN